MNCCAMIADNGRLSKPHAARRGANDAGRSGPKGTRTLDLFNAIEALSQLSYRPAAPIMPENWTAVKINAFAYLC